MNPTSNRRYAQVETPLGVLSLQEGPGGLERASFDSIELTGTHCPDLPAARQAQAWFAGERTTLDVEVAPEGTPFQRLVWKHLSTIPFGTTQSYGEVAKALDRPTASRAVGAANGRNPVALFIPCHRVIGSNGSLTGYAGGLHRKQWLLRHEATQAELFV